jgi:hypothetical protein
MINHDRKIICVKFKKLLLRFVEDPGETRIDLDFDLETRKGLDFNLDFNLSIQFYCSSNILMF